MTKLLLLYASKGGSTAEVAEFIGTILEEQDIAIDVISAEHFDGNLRHYDGIILGTPIYKGVWMTSLWRAVRNLETQLKNKPIWGFSLCMRVLEAGGQDYAEYHYLPHNVLDKLNLQDYRFFSGRLQNLTMAQRHEFHETYDGLQGRQEGDYRDWNAIRAWALQIAKTALANKQRS